MKKLIFILMVGNLFAQDIQKLSDTEKMIYFEKDKKSALTAVALEVIMPSGGYNYLNKINYKNVTFSLTRFGLEVGSLISLSLAQHETDYETFAVYEITGFIFFGGYSLLTLIQMHDLINKTEKYNINLYKQIFGKEPPSFSLNLQPTYQGANLTMSYAFN